MAEEEQLLHRFRQLPATGRQSLVDYAEFLHSQQREPNTVPAPALEDPRRSSASRTVSSGDDIGRFRHEQAGI